VLATKVSVFVAADNRLLRETLARMLMKKGNIEVTGLESGIPMQAEAVAKTDADVLLLASRGALNDDLLMIQEVRVSAPGIRILPLGMAKNEAEFLQCVRRGHQGIPVARRFLGRGAGRSARGACR
jgi:DNA-binding NarL/FixJ family response regulator